MTVFDLLFLALLLAALATLVAAAISAVRGRWPRALRLLRGLGLGAAAYLAIVYAVTAASKPLVLPLGEPQCNDDWCLAVDSAKRTPKGDATVYRVSLRIFSRALRRPQREMTAKDVYLVDASWKRYDPVPGGSETPLDTLLQPGESVHLARTFELPAGAHATGLLIGRRSLPPVCLIIGECGAFHKAPMARLD